MLSSWLHLKLLGNSFSSYIIFFPRWPGLGITFEPFNGMLNSREDISWKANALRQVLLEDF